MSQHCFLERLGRACASASNLSTSRALVLTDFGRGDDCPRAPVNAMHLHFSLESSSGTRSRLHRRAQKCRMVMARCGNRGLGPPRSRASTRGHEPACPPAAALPWSLVAAASAQHLQVGEGTRWALKGFSARRSEKLCRGFGAVVGRSSMRSTVFLMPSRAPSRRWQAEAKATDVGGQGQTQEQRAVLLNAEQPEEALAGESVTAHQGKGGESNAEEEEAEVLIELKNVYKSFGSKHILRGASFKIREGEAVGIIGPSGTGKSTVLKVMAGLLAPDKGEVWICGKKRQGLLSDQDDDGLRIGLVFQSAALFDSLTVKENVGFLLYEHSDLAENEIEERVRDSLLAVGLKGVENRMPAELSGGMRKRVALARAIISDGEAPQLEREVVMYDEPTAGLDPIASTVVEDLIRSLHIQTLDGGLQVGKIASYIVVTHQHSTIRRAVDRLLFLYDGQVQWEGPVDEFDTTDNPIVRQFADGSLNGPIQYI